MTMIEFPPLERSKTYEAVVHRIQDEIFSGRLRPGDRLPGERQLSEQLGVSRPSVREAVRMLQAMEIVNTSPGTGSSSGLIVTAHPSRALTRLLGIHVALSSYDVSEVMKVRVALEVEAVQELANPDRTYDLTAVEKALDRMRDASDDRSLIHDLDTEFHLELARATGNTLLADLMAALRASVRRPMDEAFNDVTSWGAVRLTILQGHRELFEAISAKDPERAGDLVRRHITGFYDSVQRS